MSAIAATATLACPKFGPPFPFPFFALRKDFLPFELEKEEEEEEEEVTAAEK